MAATDIELMLRVKEHDDVEAFQEIYERYKRRLGKFLYGCTYDYTLAEDLLQEALVKLWKARHRYEPSGKFSTYLFQIAKNHWLNEREKIGRRPKVLSLDAERSSGKGETFTVDHASDDPGPSYEVLTNEMDGKVREAIDSLPEKHRMVFLLGEIEQMKYSDIAEILEIPVGTVKSRMSNAIKKLREKLKGYMKTS